jgi:hypothetical protein
MLLGSLLAGLDEADAAAALEALGDIVLYAQVESMAARFGERPGEYASGATRRFAAAASEEDWLAVMAAIARSEDPTRTLLARMVRWSLARDAAAEAGGGRAGEACACGGGGRAHHDHA